ncbi:Integrin-linked protein kinase 1 [Ancistrocladus abbreviatus]
MRDLIVLRERKESSKMDVASQMKRAISRQFSTGSLRKSGRFSFRRQSSHDPQRTNLRFSFGRQSSLDPIRRSSVSNEPLTVAPENLDATMQLLFMACRGDAKGVQQLLDDGIDVNSIDLDGRTALHIAAYFILDIQQYLAIYLSSS